MKVLHTIEVMDERYGGLPICTANLIEGLRQLGVNAEVLTLSDGQGWGPIKYSKKVTNYLKESNPDIYHPNGLWMHIVHATCNTARKKGKPYILTPHGMLYKEALRIHYWKKWPMLAAWFRNDVMKADCVHVTCLAEKDELRNFGYRGPIAVIGNPVKVTEEINRIFENRVGALRQRTGGIKLGYLGRLHPRKRVELILQAISIANTRNVSLKIIGDGEAKYIAYLKGEIDRLNLSDKVTFTGYIGGIDKYKELAQLDSLIVPSDMENFGMIVPEALLVGTPVFASTGTPWEILNTLNAGWWRNNSPMEIANVIDLLSFMSPSELSEMGLRGREYIIQNYDSINIARKMSQLYNWILGNNEKPSFVYED